MIRYSDASGKLADRLERSSVACDAREYKIKMDGPAQRGQSQTYSPTKRQQFESIATEWQNNDEKPRAWHLKETNGGFRQIRDF